MIRQFMNSHSHNWVLKPRIFVNEYYSVWSFCITFFRSNSERAILYCGMESVRRYEGSMLWKECIIQKKNTHTMPGALSMLRLLFDEGSNVRPYESSISCLEKKCCTSNQKEHTTKKVFGFGKWSLIFVWMSNLHKKLWAGQVLCAHTLNVRWWTFNKLLPIQQYWWPQVI